MKSIFTTLLQCVRITLLLAWMGLRFLFKRLHFTWVVLMRIGSGRIIHLHNMHMCWKCFKRRFHIIDLHQSQSLGKW